MMWIIGTIILVAVFIGAKRSTRIAMVAMTLIAGALWANQAAGGVLQ